MKKLWYMIAILAAAFVLTACGGDDDEPTNPGHPQPEGATLMQVSALIGSNSFDYPTPRLIFRCDGMMTAEINDPNQPDVLMLQVVGQDKEADALVMVSTKNIVIAHYNPSTDTTLPKEVLLAGDFDDFSTLSYATIDWLSGEVELRESLPLSGEGKPSMIKATRGENDAIKKPFFDMVDYISAEIGKMGEKMDKFGKAGKSGKAVCTAINEVVVPLMRYNLYADDEIAQQKYVEEYVQDKSKKLFCKVTGIDEDYLNFALWAYNNANRLKIGSDDDPTDYTGKYYPVGHQQATTVANVVNQSASVLNSTIRQNTDVEVSVEVTNVGETSIGLKGSVKFDDSSFASYLSAGYCYYNGSQEVRITSKVTNSGQIEPGSITKLEPATRYAVAAFYEPMVSSHTFYSSFVDVVTRGVLFTPAQNAIEFPSDGGSEGVPIKMGYKTEWKITSSPDWCACQQQEGKLIVKAQKNESTAARSQTIVLQATGYYGDQTEARIQVTQQGQKDDGGGEDEGDVGSWADTKWQMNGSITAEGETMSDSFIADFTGGTVRFTGGVMAELFSAAKYSASLSGNELTVSLHVVIYSNHETGTSTTSLNFRFRRNGDSVTCSVNGTEVITGGDSYSISGQYTGTRQQ